MTPFRFGGHPSRKTAILLMNVAAVSVAALVWMGVRLMRQDRALEAQQLEDRREAAAARLVASLEQALSVEERRLAGLPGAGISPSSSDAVWLIAGASQIRVWPERALLYYPLLPPGREPPARLFAEAEKWEFLERDYGRAATILRSLARAEDPATRAGARLRLARVLRKAGDPESALDVYAELAGASASAARVSVSGVPADLVARQTRCALLGELDRRAELEKEARSLYDDLTSGRWRLDRPSFVYHRDRAAQYLNPMPEFDASAKVLEDAVVWLWQNRRAVAGETPGSAGRRVHRLHGASVTILWRLGTEGLAAVVAGPGYQRSRWFEPILAAPDFSGVRAVLLGPEKVPVYGQELPDDALLTTRPASVTGLPWDIGVANADLEADLSQFAQRRRLMMMGLGMLALLVVASVALIGRAVSRELAAARLQSDFVSAVSHEFRTPLTSMRQFTEMLAEDENIPPEKRRAFYEAQSRATRRLSRLVESLLDFGRMEAGARPYRLERLDVGRLVEATVEEFKQEAGRDGLTMECRIPEEGPPARADREALAQALWNLLDNAVKYSEGKPVVEVEVEAGREEIAVRVRDRGIGISPSEKDRILRKFVRGADARARGVKGTGIGLAMVKHIIDAHGGKVEVASEPGRGSTFTIRLPAGG